MLGHSAVYAVYVKWCGLVPSSFAEPSAGHFSTFSLSTANGNEDWIPFTRRVQFRKAHSGANGSLGQHGKIKQDQDVAQKRYQPQEVWECDQKGLEAVAKRDGNIFC